MEINLKTHKDNKLIFDETNYDLVYDNVVPATDFFNNFYGDKGEVTQELPFVYDYWVHVQAADFVNIFFKHLIGTNIDIALSTHCITSGTMLPDDLYPRGRIFEPEAIELTVPNGIENVRFGMTYRYDRNNLTSAAHPFDDTTEALRENVDINYFSTFQTKDILMNFQSLAMSLNIGMADISTSAHVQVWKRALTPARRVDQQ